MLPRVRKFRFQEYIAKQQAMSKLVKKTLHRTTVQEKIVIAFGDGSFSSSSPGHAAGPKKKLIQELKRQPNVELVMTTEYNTSKKCCHCHQELDEFQLCDDEQKKREEQEKINASKKGRNPKVISSGLYAVRMCNHECRIVWNRDENAAWNILSIFLYQQQHGGIVPTEFKRDPEEKGSRRKRKKIKQEKEDASALYVAPHPSCSETPCLPIISE